MGNNHKNHDIIFTKNGKPVIKLEAGEIQKKIVINETNGWLKITHESFNTDRIVCVTPTKMEMIIGHIKIWWGFYVALFVFCFSFVGTCWLGILIGAERL